MAEAILPKSPLVASIPNASFPTAGQGLVLDLNGKLPASLLSTTYRKTAPKVVNTTVAATDLLNGEVTVAAGAMGATGLLRLTAWGDAVQQSGAGAAGQRFQLLLGGTTLLDTGAGLSVSSGVTRYTWRLTAEILNLTATTQVVRVEFEMYLPSGITTGQVVWLTGTGGGYSNGNFYQGIGSGTGTKDTTAALALALNVINGSASASYETKLLGALVEIV